MNSLLQNTSRYLEEHSALLAEALVARLSLAGPELAQRCGTTGRAKHLQEVHCHLAYLSQAIFAGDPVLFTDHVGWAKIMLLNRNRPPEDLAYQLEVLRKMLRAHSAVKPARAGGGRPLSLGGGRTHHQPLESSG